MFLSLLVLVLVLLLMQSAFFHVERSVRQLVRLALPVHAGAGGRGYRAGVKRAQEGDFTHAVGI